MKSIYFKLLKFTLFCLILLFCADVSSARDIRVKLSDAGKYSISSAGKITLTDSKNKSHSLGKSPALSVSKGAVISGKSRFTLPATLKSGSPIGFKGYKYRGTLKITKSGELINVLNIEDYLRGVLKAEASPNWPMEYLKVQAIVARTFAIRESLAARSREFDVTDSTSSQVYHGMSAETSRTDRAVKETKDRVLAYGNELAFTPYHSDSGGATANNADVWGRDLPYLRSVKEPMTYKSPNSSWELRISSSELSNAVRKVSPKVGNVKDIKILNTDKHGRAVNFKITGSASSATVKASALRTAVGPNKLKSTFLVLSGAKSTKTPAPAGAKAKPVKTPKADIGVINDGGPLTPEEDTLLNRLFTEGAFSKNEMIDILMKPEKRKEYLYKILAREIKPKQNAAPTIPDIPSDEIVLASGNSIPFQNGHFIFRGKGWGHGVGMSQYGAMTLANSGWNSEKILTHYFPGTKIKTVTTR